MSTINSATEAGAAPEIIDGVVELPSPFPLHHGGQLSSARLSYRLAGPAGAPVVVALGGISAHKYRYGRAKTTGWWHALVGPGLGLDTSAFAYSESIISAGAAHSTAPSDGEPFPTISAWDQAAALSAPRTVA